MKIDFPEARDFKLRHVQTRIEKHGENDVPAIDLAVSVTGSNRLLDMIHPDMRPALFKALTETPGELPLPTDDLPSVRFPSLRVPIGVDTEHQGVTVRVAYGATGKASMVIGLVRLHKVRVAAVIEGGSVEIQFSLSSSAGIDEKLIGKLSLLQGHEISMTIEHPEVEQSETVSQKQAKAKAETEALFNDPPVNKSTESAAQTPEEALAATAQPAE